MAYERIASPPEVLYHYTNKENLPAILADGRIRKFQDKECWFCSSVENTLRLMELTVMNEGGLYIGINGIPKRSPKFQPDEYVILELTPRYQNGEWVKWNQEIDSRCSAEQKALAEEFSSLKIGYRGDLKFKSEPKTIEISEALQLRASEAPTMQGFCY
ncbi:hypothetical protein GKG47_13695 [Lactonifactor sp. BIOML-A3]|uniref:hypothetical protein n=1 Tax=Clostridia TaxID=186801 RepID=UPI0012AEF4E2|nr:MULTISPECIES: hypothetical protein [Clostridia]MCB5713601.1 hypothetical protein [Lactonifactor longoviformis]MCB5717700.1 hypothetical protein [Lactonifactor longoviformis]MSA02836.1 hypothetical protein [Lactonifactor sp. BIOML-A5]MSA09138.1 hypothetical protein [Lactonifactor sp. BIOML-A4]MSA13483.1 hypothetical protein [Lactonifactor sp. BIOML-A3]